MEFRLVHATVYVRDFARAVEFYDVELGLPLRFRDDRAGRAAFATEGADLEIARVSPDHPEARFLVGRETGIVLTVPDLDAAYEVLRERGVPFPARPRPGASGGRVAWFEDPDGNRLALEEAVRPT